MKWKIVINPQIKKKMEMMSINKFPLPILARKNEHQRLSKEEIKEKGHKNEIKNIE